MILCCALYVYGRCLCSLRKHNPDAEMSSTCAGPYFIWNMLQYYNITVLMYLISAAKPMVQDWFKARCVEPLPSNGGVR